MIYDEEKGIVTIYTKNYKIDTLASRLAGLNGSQVSSFFANRGMLLPRKLNVMALTAVLNEKIKTLTSNSLKKDYFQKLQYYKSFSEIQLLALYNEIADASDFKLYRTKFWKLILLNYVGLNLNDGEIQYLITIKKLSMESFDKYTNYIFDICCENNNTFDGQDIELLKNNLVNSASAETLSFYGTRYNIDIPSRLNKQQLAEYIKDIQKSKKKLFNEAEIDQMNITLLNGYAKAHGINMQSNMNKQQLVDYLFYYLSKCEILTTTLKRVVSSLEYEPLEFSVDLSAASNFNSTEAKKIIYYADEEIIENKEQRITASVKEPTKNVKKPNIKKEEAVVLEANSYDALEDEEAKEVKKEYDPLLDASAQVGFYYEEDEKETIAQDEKTLEESKEEIKEDSVVEDLEESKDVESKEVKEDVETIEDSIVEEKEIEETLEETIVEEVLDTPSLEDEASKEEVKEEKVAYSNDDILNEFLKKTNQENKFSQSKENKEEVFIEHDFERELELLSKKEVVKENTINNLQPKKIEEELIDIENNPNYGSKKINDMSLDNSHGFIWALASILVLVIAIVLVIFFIF